jgi:hypothetical protein
MEVPTTQHDERDGGVELVQRPAQTRSSTLATQRPRREKVWLPVIGRCHAVP